MARLEQFRDVHRPCEADEDSPSRVIEVSDVVRRPVNDDAVGRADIAELAQGARAHGIHPVVVFFPITSAFCYISSASA